MPGLSDMDFLQGGLLGLFPPPERGRVREGVKIAPSVVIFSDPHPDPPPFRGREREVRAPPNNHMRLPRHDGGGALHKRSAIAFHYISIVSVSIVVPDSCPWATFRSTGASNECGPRLTAAAKRARHSVWSPRTRAIYTDLSIMSTINSPGASLPRSGPSQK
jgi:hypothetical protein